VFRSSSRLCRGVARPRPLGVLPSNCQAPHPAPLRVRFFLPSPPRNPTIRSRTPLTTLGRAPAVSQLPTEPTPPHPPLLRPLAPINLRHNPRQQAPQPRHSPQTPPPTPSAGKHNSTPLFASIPCSSKHVIPHSNGLNNIAPAKIAATTVLYFFVPIKPLLTTSFLLQV